MNESQVALIPLIRREFPVTAVENPATFTWLVEPQRGFRGESPLAVCLVAGEEGHSVFLGFFLVLVLLENGKKMEEMEESRKERRREKKEGRDWKGKENERQKKRRENQNHSSSPLAGLPQWWAPESHQKCPFRHHQVFLHLLSAASGGSGGPLRQTVWLVQKPGLLSHLRAGTRSLST